MPQSGAGISHLATHKPDAIVSGIRFDLAYHSARAGPCRDSGASPDGRANRSKCETCCAVHMELAVGNVVIHVALPGMRLAPGVFMRRNILAFGEVSCAL